MLGRRRARCEPATGASVAPGWCPLARGHMPTTLPALPRNWRIASDDGTAVRHAPRPPRRRPRRGRPGRRTGFGCRGASHVDDAGDDGLDPVPVVEDAIRLGEHEDDHRVGVDADEDRDRGHDAERSHGVRQRAGALEHADHLARRSGEQFLQRTAGLGLGAHRSRRSRRGRRVLRREPPRGKRGRSAPNRRSSPRSPGSRPPRHATARRSAAPAGWSAARVSLTVARGDARRADHPNGVMRPCSAWSAMTNDRSRRIVVRPRPPS